MSNATNLNVTRRGFLKTAGLGAATCLLPGCLSPRTNRSSARPSGPAGRKPNLVVIVSDDQGWNNVGYHNKLVRTPNIDRIAHEGVELDRFYACPLCTPTRSGLLTGRYPLRFGMMCSVATPWKRYGLPTDERLLPAVLADAGYTRRGCFGKWHIGHCHVKYHPLERGFTHFYGAYNGAIDYYTHMRESQLDWHRNHRPAREEGYATDLISDEAAKFIADSPADEPFFLYVPYTAPHYPMQVPQKYLDMYELEGPEPADEKAAKLRRFRRAFNAMVTCMDDGIGRILKAIEDKGVDDDTFVLFFSDNGAGIGGDSTPLRENKTDVYDGGIRVLAAARWINGGIAGGRKITTTMGYIDVLPTLMAMAGVTDHKGKPLDGVDVTDVMRGKSKGPDRPWYSFVGVGNMDRLAVMEGPWKLVYIGPPILDSKDTPAEATVELFRIWDDPSEKTDLAAKHPDIAAEYLAKVRAFRALQSPICLNNAPSERKSFKAPTDWILEGTTPEMLKK